MADIIQRLEDSGLKGRGGADFPTTLKWKMVKEEKAEKKFVICNASEGEPGVFKDGYILENHPEDVIEGMKIAIETLGQNTSGYIYLRKDYFKKFKDKLEKLTAKLPIKLFCETGGYLCGEESTLLESIEGKGEEPRVKPPFPTQKGLFGYPTLVNNVETFYYVSKIAKGEYKKTRFYSICWAHLPGGIIEKEPYRIGVFELPEDMKIKDILKKTKNVPPFEFFLQIGGGASGKIITQNELEEKVCGAGAIVIYNKKETDPILLLKEWVSFFMRENCDKCVPCREGLYRLYEDLEDKKIDKKILNDIIFVLEKTSFCGLGKGAAMAIKTLSEKILKI
jgi:NADH:ubiquinone oxidoreductase subunit F (NADH-binding)